MAQQTMGGKIMRRRSASYILFIDNDPVDTAFTLKQGLKKFHAVKDYVFRKQN